MQPSDHPEKNPVNTEPAPVVKGRRLVEKEESFVMSGPPRIEPGSTEGEHQDDQAGFDVDADCVICARPFVDGDATIFLEAEGGNAHTDCVNQAAKNIVTELSEAEQVIQSESPSEDYWMLVEVLPQWEIDHKTDSQAEREYLTEVRPLNLHYLEVIRREAQKAELFGRQHFRCTTYKRGQGLVKGGLWRRTMTISKPELTAAAPLPGAPQIPAGSPGTAMKDYMNELADSVAVVRKIAGVGQTNASPAPALPPSDPLGDMGRTLVLDLTKKALENAINPPAPATTGAPGEKSTATEVLDFMRELGISDIIKEGMRHIGLPLLANAVRNRMANPNVGAPTPNAEHQPQAGLPGGEPPQNVPRETLPPPANSIPSEAVELVLRPLVGEMMADVSAGVGQDDYQYNVSPSVQSILVAAQLYEPAADFIRRELLPKSGVQLLIWLGEASPEWKLLASIDDAQDYAGWLNDLRIELRDAMAEAPAAESESEPPAVAGGQNVSRETTEGESVETLSRIVDASTIADDIAQARKEFNRGAAPIMEQIESTNKRARPNSRAREAQNES